MPCVYLVLIAGFLKASCGLPERDKPIQPSTFDRQLPNNWDGRNDWQENHWTLVTIER